jgi:hypothetical protein
MWLVIARLVLYACMLAACGGCGEDPARVRLVPVRPVETGSCGNERPRPSELVVIAYAPSGEELRPIPVDEAIPIGDFPEDTEQIGVEARLAGSTIAVGKTAPIVFRDLPDGTTLPIFMAPPDGFCPVGDMRSARRAPLVARAGDGVLIVGGLDGDGNPLKTAERYDPATGTFVDVVVPALLGQNGFVGATLTSLPDGRVVIAGGPQAVASIYNPATHAFGESVLIESRAFHAALATDGNELLLLGGCSAIEMGGCAATGVFRLGSKLYEASDVDTVRELAPSTTLRAGRIGAKVFDIGPQLDGKRSFVIAGGLPPRSGPPDAADVFAVGASDAVAISGSFFAAAALDGGAVLTAFAPDGDPANGTAAVFPPSADARPIARAPDLVGARLVSLENGRVVAIGGDAGGDITRYDPTIDAWERVDAEGPVVTAPVTHRLDDGSVLVLGGDAISNRAFVYRPPLLGATSGSVNVTPIGPARANVLTPSDPTAVTRGVDWLLASGAAPFARALVGGPRMATGTMTIRAKVKAGTVGLVAQQTGPGRAIVVELDPAAPSRVTLFDGGTQTTLCTGDIAGAFDRDTSVTLTLEVSGNTVRARRDAAELVTCEVAGVAGAWGVAAIGPGAEVAIETVSLVR